MQINVDVKFILANQDYVNYTIDYTNVVTNDVHLLNKHSAQLLRKSNQETTVLWHGTLSALNSVLRKRSYIHKDCALTKFCWN